MQPVAFAAGPQEALDQGHAALRVKGGLDVGPLPAMLAYDGRLSYHGAPAKAAARFAAHAQWGELLASVAAVRAMLPGVRAGGEGEGLGACYEPAFTCNTYLYSIYTAIH